MKIPQNNMIEMHSNQAFHKIRKLRIQGQITLGPKSWIPLMLASPNMEAKSQVLSLYKPLKYG